MRKISRRWIAAAVAVLIMSAALTIAGAGKVRVPDYDQKLAAAQLMQACMDRRKCEFRLVCSIGGSASRTDIDQLYLHHLAGRQHRQVQPGKGAGEGGPVCGMIYWPGCVRWDRR